jgi:hypothetical protein
MVTTDVPTTAGAANAHQAAGELSLMAGSLETIAAGNRF